MKLQTENTNKYKKENKTEILRGIAISELKLLTAIANWNWKLKVYLQLESKIKKNEITNSIAN